MSIRHLIERAGKGVLLLAALLTTGISQAAGLLQPADGSLPPLEIRDHEVEVVIEDSYAVTQVEQVFFNPHDRDLEAHYSFPVPEHGSVAEFTLWIDGQPVTGEVLEKKEARRVYEEEKAAGRDAGLTEKDEYKTFEVQVSPVRAGQETRIRLVYLQPAHLDTGIGRYVYPLEEGGVDEQKLAFWTANERVERNFSFDVRIRSAYPIEAVRMPNQPQAQPSQLGQGDWQIHLASGNNSALAVEEGEKPLPANNATAAFTLDQDLVVYWRHQAGLPGSVDLVAHKPEGAKRGTFMMVVTPGDDLQPIQQGKDWIFVLDISGSMQGKYATLADGVERALKKLHPDDRFRIVLFNDRAKELTSGYVNATPEAVNRWARKMASIQPDNGTNLFAGLEKGLNSLDADRTSALVLVTDGVANVGETRQRQFIELIKQRDIRLFTFIMGNSANRPLLEAVTKASNGFALSISNSDDIVGQLLLASSKVTHQALHGVEVAIDGVKTADFTPEEIGSLYRGEQLVLFGHYFGDGMADVKVKGRISGQEKVYQTRFPFPAKASDNPEIERLWAYAMIEDAMAEMADFGEKADLKQAIIDLGMEYGLVTDYTSMVVVRDEVFDQRGIERTNRDRLAIEEAASQQRAGQAPVSRRVDSQQPMYTSSRPSFGGGGSGGGALDPWSLLLLLPLAWVAWSSRKRQLA
jgi:Ca-activated chloride channel family protein